MRVAIAAVFIKLLSLFLNVDAEQPDQPHGQQNTRKYQWIGRGVAHPSIDGIRQQHAKDRTDLLPCPAPARAGVLVTTRKES